MEVSISYCKNHFIKNNENLYNGNLIGFDNFNDENLKELEEYMDLALSVKSSYVTNNGLKFL